MLSNEAINMFQDLTLFLGGYGLGILSAVGCGMFARWCGRHRWRVRG